MGVASLVTAAVVAGRGARDLGRNLTPIPRPLAEAELVQTGIYARIRHPLYAAVMLSAFGWAAFASSARALIPAAMLAIWLEAKARREEAWLLHKFPGYAAYRDRTHRFIPSVY